VVVVSAVIALVGVVGAIAAILSISVLAEKWLPADEPPPSDEQYERPLVRIIKADARRQKAA
jgi:hypothetical protein